MVRDVVVTGVSKPDRRCEIKKKEEGGKAEFEKMSSN